MAGAAKRKWILPTAAAAVLTIAVGITAWWWMGREDGPVAESKELPSSVLNEDQSAKSIEEDRLARDTATRYLQAIKSGDASALLQLSGSPFIWESEVIGYARMKEQYEKISEAVQARASDLYRANFEITGLYQSNAFDVSETKIDRAMLRHAVGDNGRIFRFELTLPDGERNTGYVAVRFVEGTAKIAGMIEPREQVHADRLIPDQAIAEAPAPEEEVEPLPEMASTRREVTAAPSVAAPQPVPPFPESLRPERRATAPAAPTQEPIYSSERPTPVPEFKPSVTAGPGKVYELMQRDIERGDFYSAAHRVYLGFSPSVSQTLARKYPGQNDFERVMAMLHTRAAENINKKGGFRSLRVQKEEIAGTTAEVQLAAVFGNGETGIDRARMVRIDGQWMFDLEATANAQRSTGEQVVGQRGTESEAFPPPSSRTAGSSQPAGQTSLPGYARTLTEKVDQIFSRELQKLKRCEGKWGTTPECPASSWSSDQ